MSITRIATSSADDITLRGKSLPRELIGKLSFTEMTCFVILGEVPSPARIACIDACLVALMEHGLTPSALATPCALTVVKGSGRASSRFGNRCLRNRCRPGTAPSGCGLRACGATDSRARA